MTSGSERAQGRYYDGRRADAETATVAVYAGRLVAMPPVFEPVELADVRIAPRLGRLPRTLRLPGGGVFETEDVELIDRWFGCETVDRLERNLPAVLVSLVLLTATLAAATVWGVPYLARVVAERLPADVLADAGRQALDQLDHYAFEPSTLDLSRRAKLAMLFGDIAPSGDELVYRLEFRDGGAFGPNAFALPDGTVVLTDQLVRLAPDDDAIAVVMLHEFGHLEGRHSARLALSHAGLAALAFTVFGDVSAASALVVAAPNVLMSSAYSQDMEWDADSYALERMGEDGIPGGSFAQLLQSMPADETPGLLSTHPPSLWRIARFTQH